MAVDGHPFYSTLPCLVIKVSKASYSYNLFSSLFAKSVIVRFVLHSIYL